MQGNDRSCTESADHLKKPHAYARCRHAILICRAEELLVTKGKPAKIICAIVALLIACLICVEPNAMF